MRNPRVLLAAGVVLAALVVGGALLALGGGGGGSDAADDPPRVVRSELTLERFVPPGTTQSELLVSLATPELNTPDVTGGARVVSLRCVDDGGAVVIRSPARWPLIEEPGFFPHIHQPADAGLLASVRACRLTGPGIDFAGRVAGRLPTAE